MARLAYPTVPLTMLELLSHKPLGRKEAARLPNPTESGKQELARLAGQSLAGESDAPRFEDVFMIGAGLRPSNGLCAVGAVGGNRQIIVDTGSNIPLYIQMYSSELE